MLPRRPCRLDRNAGLLCSVARASFDGGRVARGSPLFLCPLARAGNFLRTFPRLELPLDASLVLRRELDHIPHPPQHVDPAGEVADPLHVGVGQGLGAGSIDAKGDVGGEFGGGHPFRVADRVFVQREADVLAKVLGPRIRNGSWGSERGEGARGMK